jgi:hypothetical protein
MSATTNTTIARRVFEDGLNGRNAKVFEALVADDYVWLPRPADPGSFLGSGPHDAIENEARGPNCTP